MNIPDAQHFLARINEIVGMDITNPNARMQFNPADHTACKGVILRLRVMQKELRLVKQEISAVISVIKSEFTTARTQVGKGFGDALAAGFFGRKRMGSVNASEKDRLRRRQADFVSSYEVLKGQIDRIIASLDSAKGQIELSPEYQLRPQSALKRTLSTHSALVPPALPPPLPKTIRYFVYLGGEVKGPYVIDQLSALWDAGTITDETQLCLEGTENWQVASEVISG